LSYLKLKLYLTHYNNGAFLAFVAFVLRMKYRTMCLVAQNLVLWKGVKAGQEKLLSGGNKE